MPQNDSLPSRRIAIISDTHGVIDVDIADVVRQCDEVIHAGDICGASVLNQLEQLSDKVTAVTGNNDIAALWAEHEAHVVNTLPRVAELDLPGGKLVVEHGHLHGMQHPCHDSLRTTYQHARVIIYGHTHSQVCDVEASPWVINPGAAGATRTRGGPSCLVLTAHHDKEWEIETLRFEDKAI